MLYERLRFIADRRITTPVHLVLACLATRQQKGPATINFLAGLIGNPANSALRIWDYHSQNFREKSWTMKDATKEVGIWCAHACQRARELLESTEGIITWDLSERMLIDSLSPGTNVSANELNEDALKLLRAWQDEVNRYKAKAQKKAPFVASEVVIAGDLWAAQLAGNLTSTMLIHGKDQDEITTKIHQAYL